MLQFPHLWNGGLDSNYPLGFLQEVLQGKHLEQDLDRGKLYTDISYYYHFYYHSNSKPQEPEIMPE